MSQTQPKPDRGSPPSTPRWVKVFIILFIILVVLIVILHILGLGFSDHGAGGAGGTLSGGLAGYTLFIEHAVQKL